MAHNPLGAVLVMALALSACSDNTEAAAVAAREAAPAAAGSSAPAIASAASADTVSAAPASPDSMSETAIDTMPAVQPMTANQQQLVAADSLRQVRQAATADSAQAAQVDSVAVATIEMARTDSLQKSAQTRILRETFAYGGGSRDPFASLINSKTAGPELADLQLVGVYQDLRYAGNSVAVLRHKTTTKRYKLRIGDQVGRLKVAQIRPKDVIFSIADFGFERQETLSLRKQEELIP